MSEGRTAELGAALAAVRDRIATACSAAGRDPAEVTLVVVTKTFPTADVARLADLGVTDVGENRDQEAAVKADALADRGLRWHFVGQLQRNKARSVAAYADLVHSLDRPRLVGALDRAADAAGRRVDVLVQVDLSGPLDPTSTESRGGAAPDDVLALADAVASSAGLRLRGVMAVAPRDADPAVAFGRLATCSRVLREQHPEAAWISAGMSGDLEQAVDAGATHLRVGSAILGRRPPLE